MEQQLRQIAANKPAGTYFIVNDKSNASEIMPNINVRLAFINEKQGPVNTMVYFERGATDAFTNMFGKRNRRAERLGNFSIKECLTMIEAGPLCVINLRAFDAEFDKTTVSSLGANKISELIKESVYSNLFNKNGFWTPKAHNIIKQFGNDENLLNFANVGEGDISIFVTIASPAEVSAVTSEAKKALVDVDLEIQDYEALLADANKKLEDTFVKVYVFKNSFADFKTNIMYNHLFNDAGMVTQVNIDKLAQIKAAGLRDTFVGSLIPHLKQGNNELSIDTIINQYYQETGLYCAINSEVLEYDSYNDLPVLNTLAQGYHKLDGSLIDNGNLLSYRYQENNAEHTVTINLPDEASNKSYRDKEALIYTGDIIPSDTNGQQVFAILENGVRVGDILTFESATGEIYDANVTQMLKEADETHELPKVDVTGVTYTVELDVVTNKPVIKIVDAELTNTHNILRKRASDRQFVVLRTNVSGAYMDESVTTGQEYDYVITVNNVKNSPDALEAVRIKIAPGSVSTPSTDKPTLTPVVVKYTKVRLVVDKPVEGTSYMRRLKPSETPFLQVKPTVLIGYKQRQEQFINGTPGRQDEVLNVMLTPSISNGLSKYNNIGYFVDTFKSYVESDYKKQYSLLIQQQADCNRFITFLGNEPFINDFEDSQNPLFKATPNGDLDLGAYLATGGNLDFSTIFLSKTVSGQPEMCYFIGCDIDDSINVYPLAATLSNLYINKQRPWDIVANTKGILSIPGVALEPSEPEKFAMEKFKFNYLIKIGSNYRVYGNMSAQQGNGALSHFNNAELLKYIKTELYNLSIKEGFTTGTYDEFFNLETEVQDFMNSLALQNAIKPNPVVKVIAVNDDETEQAGIKLVEVEYINYRTLDKVVFNLNLK